MKVNGCIFFALCFMLALAGCSGNDEPKDVLFDVLSSEKTGLKFNNRLNSTDSFNLFKYMYFYNGAGVGVGDFNNDGLVDIFFSSNQGQNSLYINQGKFQFKDVTGQAKIPSDKAWSTGVSVVDINNDGLLDIYISRVGNYEMLQSKNQFLVCERINEQGIPEYKDRAAEYGLDFSGFGTQAAFFDYDLDGDLDVFLLNHSIHESGNFRQRKLLLDSFSVVSGSRLFKNEGLTFKDVSKSSGIYSTPIGYGLGIAVSDINLDGYPDIYIGNDFHENDYLYINQKNGTFSETSEEQMMHTSRYTMGVDVADANNDGHPEIMAVDMLPSDPYILRRSPGEDSYDVFHLKVDYGYSYQYSRNALQLNRKNGNFSEVGLFSGVAATDWSWSPLFFDFDNDGLKDLFISNGIPKRLNDIDYINYISDQSIQQQIIENKLNEKDKTLIEKFPQIKIPNKFYRNEGDMKFSDISGNISSNVSTYSNGAAYADFDNDGDLDIVVNNIDDDAIVYVNHATEKTGGDFFTIKFKGPPGNINGIGSRVIVYSGREQRTYEKYPVRGFMSSIETPLHVGLGAAPIDSMYVIWPDNTYQELDTAGVRGKQIDVAYAPGLTAYSFVSKNNAAHNVRDITNEVQVNYLHEENSFPEFDREPLMPHMLSTEGPALAVADINHDNLEDVFIGAAKGKRPALFLQQGNGTFARVEFIPEVDSNYEDVDAAWVDVNNDSHPDLVIASGGNEYYGKDKHLLPRVYLNDGTGKLTKKEGAITGIYQTSGCVAVHDFNRDGFADLFIGNRGIPFQFGLRPSSFLLQNDGTGKFADVTAKYSDELGNAGFVTKAIWHDINNDSQQDLVLCSEWGTVDAYIFKDGKAQKKILSDKKGWWNFILPVDVNNDGLVDLVAGNVGLNSRLRATEKEPVRLYYNDFDDNGKKEQLLTYYVEGKEIPFANKAEMERQLPHMKKRFLYAKDFAEASLEELITGKKLSESALLDANYFSSCILINKGNFSFEAVPLPWQVQLSAFRDAVVVDANKDANPDILMVGNYYENNIEMGRYDSDYGSMLIGDGKGGFSYETLNGVSLKGQSRKIKRINIKGKEAFIIARNNDSTKVIEFR